MIIFRNIRCSSLTIANLFRFLSIKYHSIEFELVFNVLKMFRKFYFHFTVVFIKNMSGIIVRLICKI